MNGGAATRALLVPAVAALLLLRMDVAVARAQSAATDQAALEALYDATDGDNWTDGTNWKSAAALSSWYGVTVDGVTGRVTALDLADNGLDGTLPAALGDLDALARLDLGANALRGALPAELADLSALQALRLDENWALSGTLPAGLGALADLAEVAIEKSELCAPEDPAFRAWLDTITFSGLTCPPAERSVIRPGGVLHARRPGRRRGDGPDRGADRPADRGNQPGLRRQRACTRSSRSSRSRR